MADFQLFGDTDGSLAGRTRAGDQVLGSNQPTDYSLLRLVGDADVLSSRAQGGDDVLLRGRGSTLELIGDARLLSGRAKGGDDTIGGEFDGASNALYGDAKEMTGRAQGGDDILMAISRSGARAAASNDVYGDAETLRDRSQGGDDVLSGVDYPFAFSRLFGDGRTLLDKAIAGDDTLISGGRNSADEMWGDAAHLGPDVTTGADTFVFQLNNGRDIIHDFEPGKDSLDLSAFASFGLHDFEALSGWLLHQPDGTLVILDFDGTMGNSVFLAGVQDLSACDVLFG
jgi:hypothetical protein